MTAPAAVPAGGPTFARAVVLGDSVIAGLGVPPASSYAMVVCAELGVGDVLNLARTTLTIDGTLALWPQVEEFAPDLVLVSVGGADGLVHPGKAIEQALTKYGPKSWGGSQGLEPRLRYSRSNRTKRLRQQLTTFLKVLMKRVGIALTGGYRRVEPEPFSAYLQEMGAKIEKTGARVVFVPPATGDEKLFPRSNASMELYRGLIDEQVTHWPNTSIVSPIPLLEQWTDFTSDRVHYDVSGHRKVADAVLAVLRSDAAQQQTSA